MELQENALLALDTIHQKQTKGIPSFLFHIMKHSYIERVAGVKNGEYQEDPERVYLLCQHNIGTCLIDQYIPKNPLKMDDFGFKDDTPRGAATGAEKTVLDGICIDSPEAVVEHMEKFVFSALQERIRKFNEKQRMREILAGEERIQEILGPNILKTGYGFISFPYFAYGSYGYENYFMAYALYPEVLERDFALQADLALLNNRAAARAYRAGNLPPLYRLDHDMADSRGTLVDIKSLDKIWFPHFARALEPILKSGVKLIWHSDGNLMQMVPRLLDVGIKGFQGFQYECGMDYEKICSLKTREGENLILFAGISATDSTLRSGTPADIKSYLQWLVDKGPKTGLFLSSMGIYPDMPWENVKVYIEGIKYYRQHGRKQ